MTRTIRIDDDTYAALATLKDEGETMDELLARLVEERREAIQEGTGLWEGIDAAEAARAAREEMKRVDTR